VVVVAALAACNRDRGAPGVKTIKPDSFLTLRGSGPKSQRIANYKIDARLDAVKHAITATETLTWTNTGTTAVDSLPFHLYLNAFKNDQSLFMKSSKGVVRGAHASDTAWGYIQVESVQVGGVELASKFHYTPPPTAKDDQTVAELPLPQPVLPNGVVEVNFKFTAQLPEVFARTGYKGDFHMVGQWFPKIGVRQNDQWECHWFHVNTEFFADFGTYDVSLTVPTTYRVAATGVLVTANEAAGNTRTLTYRAEDVHDFAWMADPYMNVLTGKAKVEAPPGGSDDTVEVRVYYRAEQKEFAQRHLDAGIGAIERFSADYVPYPWPIMSIIDPPMDAVDGAGGMEYPTLVTTAGDTVFARPGVRFPEYVTIHEVGHNWFQGMLASNEAEEAWLDEGVNDWADSHVMAELYGATGSAIDWMGWQAEAMALRRAFADDPSALPSPIATAAYAFVDNRNYALSSYDTTLRALSTLEQTVGSLKFAAAMKAYTKAWAFRHPTGRDLFATLGKELGQDLTWFFGPVFHEVGGLDVQIRTASCRPYHPPRGIFDDGSGGHKTKSEVESPETGSFKCDVVLQNTGTFHVPVDLELRFADGSVQTRTWDDKGGESWKAFELDSASRLTEVWLDPKNKLALDSPVLHHQRLEGDGAASLRAAAWVSSAAQTLMQLVGP
jgi:hypothetical protein